jgi:cytochrome c oxidase subunit 3
MTDHAAHFESLEQQAAATRLGTWVFLASEVLFFTALFALFFTYRVEYPEAFHAGARHTDRALGTLNTALLLLSSVFVAVGVELAESGRRRAAAASLAAAIPLGTAFLVLKIVEWCDHLGEGYAPGASTAPLDRGEQIFWTLYYAMTGLHAAHLTVGIAMWCVVASLVATGRLPRDRAYVVENVANYWHLVDAIWLFLWPMFYLMRGGA